jgi:hypothetical protein
LGVANNIPNKAILNTMTSIRLAGEAITSLSKKAWEQFKKQNRVTDYFERKDSHNQKYRKTEGSN